MKPFLKKAGDFIKYWAKELYLFVRSKIFLKNFGGMVALLAGTFFFTSIWMKYYTNHGESLQVPDYIGTAFSDASKRAVGQKLQLVVTDSQYIIGKPAFEILEQDPKPLSRVKENRKIYVRITRAIPPLVKLPDIKDGNDDFNQYRRKLALIDVNAKIVDRQFSNKLEPNTILEVRNEGKDITEALAEGVEVPKGTTLEFVVTERGGGRVPVPELVCKRYDAAVFLVGNFNLNIGSVVHDATVTDKYTAYVWKQRPAFNASRSLRVGEQVDIYLTQYKPDGCTTADGSDVGE
ncbi:MAG: PASTA domain-containing protein [Bacteroidota bacterium]